MSEANAPAEVLLCPSRAPAAQRQPRHTVVAPLPPLLLLPRPPLLLTRPCPAPCPAAPRLLQATAQAEEAMGNLSVEGERVPSVSEELDLQRYEQLQERVAELGGLMVRAPPPLLLLGC